MNYIDFMKTGGIRIKKENRGKFTTSAKRAGKSVQEHATDVLNDPHATRLQKRRAQFAKNAKKWKHDEGGIINAQTGAQINLIYKQSPLTDLDYLEDIETPQEQNDNTSKSSSTESSAQQSSDKWWETKAQEYLSQSSAQQETTSSNAGSSTEQSTTSESSVSTKMPERTKEVMSYLMSKGFNKEAAAGITGVFMAESGLKPGILNQDESKKYGRSAGKGLGQWSNSRRRQYDDFTKGRTSGIQTDLDFFIYDLESRPLVKQALASATSVEDAVRAMHLGYENGSSGAMSTPEAMQRTYSAAWARLGYRPYSYQESHDKRLKYANQAYASA